MRFFAMVLAVLAASGCWTSMGLRSGGMAYSQNGLFGAGPVEAATADLTSAQADRVRAEARTMEAHPELFMGRGGYGYGGYYGYQGGYGYGGARVDPNYYYAPYGYGLQTRDPALEERARELEEYADHLEDRLERLERRAP